MERSRLGYQIWAIAIYLFTTNLKGVSSMKLHRDLNVSQRTAWYLLHRIRGTMSAEGEELLEGTVEVDTAGKRAISTQRIGYGQVGNVGENTHPGIKDRETKHVRTEKVFSTKPSYTHGANMCGETHTQTA